MNNKLQLKMPTLDDIFSTEEQRQDDKLERVQEIEMDKLTPFKNHPFKVNNDAEMNNLCNSIKEHGILTPLMARPAEEGYELVSGHRRKAAAEILGLNKLPVLVRDMTRITSYNVCYTKLLRS